MGKMAFLFAGQGAQKVGMGRDIAEQYPSSMAAFDEADAALGFSMKQLIFEGPQEELDITENTQPAILAASIACLRPLEEQGIRPDAVAGLSLGEYSAHVCSGSFAYADAVKVVRRRGKFMQEEVPVGKGAMAAILALSEEQVREACAEASSAGIVEPANFNCPGQITVSGEIAAVEKACEIAKGMGAKRAMLLPVSAPFHCRMLVGAGEKLRGVLEQTEIGEMRIPVIANVSADVTPAGREAVIDTLVAQVSSSVLFENSVRKLLADGFDTFVEIGPGKTLSGFVKKINKDATILNVGDLASLEATLAALK